MGSESWTGKDKELFWISVVSVAMVIAALVLIQNVATEPTLVDYAVELAAKAFGVFKRVVLV